MRNLVLVLLFSWSAMAQHSEQPSKESSSDLRTHRVLFSIEDTGAGHSFWLERSAGMDYFLRTRMAGSDNVKKISSRDALKMDQQFAASFLKCQYELASVEGPCQVNWLLNMKGEHQEICSKDDKKSQEISQFLRELKNFL